MQTDKEQLAAMNVEELQAYAKILQFQSRGIFAGDKRKRNRHIRIVNQLLNEARYTEAKAIVAKGVCPQCGATLRYNSAIAGWWQCSQYGADGFRADTSKPQCGFQIFTQ